MTSVKSKEILISREQILDQIAEWLYAVKEVPSRSWKVTEMSLGYPNTGAFISLKPSADKNISLKYCAIKEEEVFSYRDNEPQLREGE